MSDETKKCKTCKNFKNLDGEIGQCRKLISVVWMPEYKPGDGGPLPSGVAMNPSGEERRMNELAGVQDEFGCIQHEAKEESTMEETVKPPLQPSKPNLKNPLFVGQDDEEIQAFLEKAVEKYGDGSEAEKRMCAVSQYIEDLEVRIGDAFVAMREEVHGVAASESSSFLRRSQSSAEVKKPTIGQVKALREETGVRLTVCKDALQRCDLDLEAAAEYLRTKGLRHL